VTADSPFVLEVPATSANLGPAFDSAGIALDLHLRLHATVADQFSITASGRDAELCESLESNILVDTYLDLLRRNGITSPVSLAIRLENEIPIGKGCGSSAAALVAAVLLATHYGKLEWNSDRILAEASAREQHADNVAACCFGGMVVCVQNELPMTANGGTFTAVRIEPPSWPLLLAVPEQSWSTSEARQILPESYPRRQVVANIQCSMLLTAAFMYGRSDLLRRAMHDQLHEQYREPFCSLLTAMRPLSRLPGVAGVVLSGAGPAVLVVLESAEIVEAVHKAAKAELSSRGLRAELISTRIQKKGALSYLPTREARR
jgi:homoserine kinase